MAGSFEEEDGRPQADLTPLQPQRARLAGHSSSSSTPAQFELMPLMIPTAAWQAETASGPSGQQRTPSPRPPLQRTPMRISALRREQEIMNRALPRVTQRYGLCQVIARSVTLSVAAAGFISALYLVGKWRPKRGVAGVAVGANGVAILIDTFAITNLVDASMPRVSPWAIGCFDFVMMAAALTAGLFVGLSDRGYEDEPRPWLGPMMLTAGLTWATACLRFGYVAWSCVDCGRVRRARREVGRTGFNSTVVSGGLATAAG